MRSRAPARKYRKRHATTSHGDECEIQVVGPSRMGVSARRARRHLVPLQIAKSLIPESAPRSLIHAGFGPCHAFSQGYGEVRR